jgi:hypothetical protein
MCDRKWDQPIFRKLIEEIIAEHSDAVCFRCRLRLRYHRGADHLFFERPNEAPEEQLTTKRLGA